MPSSFSIGRIGGIRIGVHLSWLVAFGLISWSLAVGYFPTSLPAAGQGTYLLMGMVGALLLFVSVLIHEMSHSFVARSRGLHVDSITLFIFGGTSNLSTEPVRPGDEFVIAIVGPLTSLALAGVAWTLSQVTADVRVVSAVLNYLAFANLVLGLFNLVPGFPLDGGRVLRGIVWGVTGNLRRATRVASMIGQAIGYSLLLLGVMSVVSGDVVGGVWMAMIGWFLSGAAEATRQEQALRDVLAGVHVGSVMDTTPPTARPQTTVEIFIFEYAVQRGHRAVLVVDNGRLLGLVTIADARTVERNSWPTTPLTGIMSRAPLQTVAPETDLADALEIMVKHSIHQLPVLRGERLVGMISRGEILRVVQLGNELHLASLVSTADVADARSR